MHITSQCVAGTCVPSCNGMYTPCTELIRTCTTICSGTVQREPTLRKGDFCAFVRCKVCRWNTAIVHPPYRVQQLCCFQRHFHHMGVKHQFNTKKKNIHCHYYCIPTLKKMSS